MTKTATKFMIIKGLLISFFFLLLFPGKILASEDFWQVRSVDTMKTSRDLTLKEQSNQSYDSKINDELEAIKNMGANYVTIDGAYDEQYLPWMKRWIDIARKKGLHVWFRGNFSGWHGWFGPKDMMREEHISATRNFILKHPDFFQDGDIFTACPECEYGGPGSPLTTGDVEGYRKFMLDEQKVMQDSFRIIGKDVKVNYTSMNPDVAKRVLDNNTVEALGNVIVLDYYVKDAKSLKEGLDYFVKKFPRAKIVLGEFGAPIPDINGTMTEGEQADFINNLMSFTISRPEIKGLNYWTSSYGTTAILNSNFKPKPSAAIVKKYYSPAVVKGVVVNENRRKVSQLPIYIKEKEKLLTTDEDGNFEIPVMEGSYTFLFGDSDQYSTYTKKISLKAGETTTLIITVHKKDKGIIWKILHIFSK